MKATALSGLRVLLIEEPFAALEFLSVLRLRPRGLSDEATLGRSQAYFPAVGLLFGGLLCGLFLTLEHEGSASLTAWLLVAALAVLSGALHLNGLADTSDGLLGGGNREQRLAIMSDSRIGAYGAVALVVVLGTKAASLAELSAGREWQALLLAPVLSRGAAVAAIGSFPSAREAGLGALFRGHSSPWRLAVAGFIALGTAIALLGPLGIAVFLSASGVALALARLLSGPVGGLTGDSMGATVECVETGVFVAFAVST